QAARDLSTTGEDLLHGHRVTWHACSSVQVARDTDLHTVHLQTRLYPGGPGRNRLEAALDLTDELRRRGAEPVAAGGVVGDTARVRTRVRRWLMSISQVRSRG